MTQFGDKTSLYLQKGSVKVIDEVVASEPREYKSRNHFINCAIIRELRRIGARPREEIE